MTEENPVEIDHSLRVCLTERGHDKIRVADLISATSTALVAGVPPNATVAIEARHRGEEGRHMLFDWSAPAEPLPSRGVLFVRSLHSGALALVRLRRR